jgi:hypothetical protein
MICDNGKAIDKENHFLKINYNFNLNKYGIRLFCNFRRYAALMDDVAVTSKLATQKTAGILGDDLAVNAEKATGFFLQENYLYFGQLPKGHLLNKLIILPIIFLLIGCFLRYKNCFNSWRILFSL